MVEHEQLAHALVADAVLAWQDERVGEELLADGADQLPLDVLDGHLVGEGANFRRPLRSSTAEEQKLAATFMVWIEGREGEKKHSCLEQ